jgi:hypothetical protein
MIHWLKIDTDPDENLILCLTNLFKGLPQQRQTLISVTAISGGYLVVTEDPPA